MPGRAPAGSYTYTLNVGRFPGVVLDGEAFTVEVTGAGQAGRGGEWAVTAAGWEPVEEREAAFTAAGSAVAVSPNPFAGQTTLRFTLEAHAEVSLVVYDVRGRAVAHLAEGAFAAGRHAVAFDAAGLTSGVYLWRLAAEGRVETGRLALVR